MVLAAYQYLELMLLVRDMLVLLAAISVSLDVMLLCWLRSEALVAMSVSLDVMLVELALMLDSTSDMLPSVRFHLYLHR